MLACDGSKHMASRLQFLRDVLPWLARPTLGNAAIINADTRPGQQPATSPTIANDGVPPHVHPITRGAEFGASGTENFGGYIRREDYNPELDNFVTAVRIYDKMRMGDAQIRAMLSVIKLPLRGATWTCLPPTDGDNVDQAIADFCNHALFEDDAMESSWDSTLRHILLQLDFGFSVLEKVWKVDDEGAYRLLRLAPRLPKTIRMWHVDRNGRLKAVVQYAPVPVSTSYPAAGSGRMLPGGGQRDVPLSGIYPGVANASPVHYGTAVSFQYLEIPAEYCLVCTLEREGDNYQGRSLLRPIYRNFYFKDQAYHQEGVRLDRWGVGIPVAQLEEGHTLNQQDLDALVEVLKAVRANERAYLIAPPHVTYDLLPKTGSATAGSGASQWIDHHDQQIARNVLAGFLTMGQDPHGTLGFGSRLTDMFVSSLNGVAAGISADLKHQVVKQLCYLNFDMTKRKYPRVTCRDLERVDLQNLVTTLATLSRSASPGKSGQQQPQAPGQTQEGAQEAAEKSAWLTPDDETEKLLRKLLDLPPMEESETRKSKKPVPPQAPAPIGAPPATAPGPEPPKPGANEDSAKAG